VSDFRGLVIALEVFHLSENDGAPLPIDVDHFQDHNGRIFVNPGAQGIGSQMLASIPYLPGNSRRNQQPGGGSRKEAKQ
jgi:hypothetical protein